MNGKRSWESFSFGLLDIKVVFCFGFFFSPNEFTFENFMKEKRVNMVKRAFLLLFRHEYPAH